MGGLEWPLLIVIGVAVLFFVVSRSRPGPTLVCTRCDGSGQVNERWPDPSEPTGWHQVEGTCPKCKGKGKV